MLPLNELVKCKVNGIDVFDATTFLEFESGRLRIDNINPSSIIFSFGFSRNKFKYSVKRISDITLASLLLIATLPISIATALLIRFTSSGPVFYWQTRVGEGNEEFRLVKFRSMSCDSEADNKPQWAKRDDDRITVVGRIIRRLHIDEIPQVYNVLKGDMSMVGPRPERPFFVDKLNESIRYYRIRHSVKPGITGWSQIKCPYGSSEKDALRKLEYDIFYLKNQNFLFDLIILIRTVDIVVFRFGSR